MDSPDLARTLYPRSIAVIGASNDASKRGHQALRRLVKDGFAGDVFPIHPTNDHILGLRCYSRLSDVPEQVDLAFIALPADAAIDAVAECARNHVGGAVVIARGFAETGGAGPDRARRLADAVRDSGMALIGPNTNGLFNLHVGLNLVGAPDLVPGGIALVTQSGNMGLTIWNEARATQGEGVGIYVGLGNQAATQFHEVIAFLAVDANVGAIVVHAEDLGNTRRFLEVASTVRHKPLVVYKAGRTSAGAESARSHTGAVAEDYHLTRSLLSQAGAVVVDRLDEVYPVASALATVPRLRGEKIAVLSDGGGHATVAADALIDQGLELADLATNTKRQLKAILPDAASVENPVDVVGATDTNPKLFAECAQILAEDDAVSGVILLGLLGGYAERFGDPSLTTAEVDAARTIGKLARSTDKPFVVQSVYDFGQRPALATLRAEGVPVQRSVEVAVGILRHLRSRRSELEIGALPGSAVRTAPTRPQLVPELTARTALAAAGVAFPRWTAVTSLDDAVRFAREVRRPLAVKALMHGVSHKSEMGAVVLDVAPTAKELQRALDACREAAELRGRELDALLVEEMVHPGLEIAAGAIWHEKAGPALMVAAGGVALEAVKDVAWRALPVDRDEIAKMLEELAAFRSHGADRDLDPGMLLDQVATVGTFLLENPHVHEVEINPFVFSAEGCTAVDALMVSDEGHGTMTGRE